MTKLSRFIVELKERKVRKWLAIFASTSLTILGAIHLFSIRFKFSTDVFNIALVLIICGLFGIIIIAWFHGKEARQSIGRTEIVLHSIIAAAGLGVISLIIFNRPVNILPVDAKTIAVLPFENMSDSKEDEFFSDGITEDIITQLSKISGLKVISRTSVMKYKNTELSIPEIAAELSVGSILEGSVRRSGDQIRIVGQLINARDDEHIWAETYDRNMKDIFAIQSEVAHQIALALKAELTPDDVQRLEINSFDNVDAYAYYLRGREHYQLFTNEDNEIAIELFDKAILLDSNYALAYAGLADAFGQRAQRFGYDETWLDSSIVMSQKAIRINPKIAEPYKALGLAYGLKGFYTKAMENYMRAISLNPNYVPAIANIAGLNCWIGRYDAAYPWVVKRFELNPGSEAAYRAFAFLYMGLELDSLSEVWYKKSLSLKPNFNLIVAELCNLYLMSRDTLKARELIEKTLSVLPDNVIILRSAGILDLFAGKLDKAKEYFLKAEPGSATNLDPKTYLGYIAWKNGDIRKAQEYFDYRIGIDTLIINSGSEDFAYSYDLAQIYSILGDKENSIKYLNKAVKDGWSYPRWSHIDPLFKNISEENEFKIVINQLSQKISRMRSEVKEKMKKSPGFKI